MLRQGFFAILLSIPAFAFSADDYVITLAQQKFTPQNLEVPAGQKITVTIRNTQAQPAEFESAQLDREKVVGAGSEIMVKLGPLQPGVYKYVDDFHEETAGTITAK